ncbi:MAG TPA: hypothetical protein VEB68_04500 [Croceibacterium sp.]|nr:hypothetical protein [Croceibacterium sp.]
MTSALALALALASQPASAQDDAAVDGSAEDEAVAADEAAFDESEETGATDILSADTLTVILDARLLLADGHQSWVDRGLGKTRFDGTADGDFQLNALPVEASLIWQPRFTRSIVGNVSASWQQGHDDEAFDVMEGYLTFIPSRSGSTSFSAKAGLYWPEISLEHATGGAWSTVYTITPSAINAWVGEEVKVIGAEATIRHSIGSQDFSATAGVFGFNDTSGTLLSFRGWALHDVKSTLFGQFPLPPLNPFLAQRQENVTRSILEIDDRPGFYGRAEWRPSSSIVLNAFYYDNRGDPQAFTHSLQWGWRTRFWNVGLVADLGPDTRLIAQGMTGTTEMGFNTNNVIWVDTRFRSAFALLTHRVGEGALSGRIEVFDTTERGSRMSPAEENEDGWAATAAVRWPLWNHFTGFLEALHVESKRGARARLGEPRKESQTVLQAALRFRW